MTVLTIGNRSVGEGHPPYVIAELSGNHNGDIERALDILRAAAAAGADAVKLQTYTADTITIDHQGPGFLIEQGLWKGRTLYELYQEAHTPWDWHPALFDEGRKLGVAVFSSPFDDTAIDFLQELNAPAFKIASFEAVDLPLVRKAARTGKPVIVSTGMTQLEQVLEVRDAVHQEGNRQVALLHCISSYPAPVDDCNLNTIPSLAESTGCVIGFSDHTLGCEIAIAAVALGASIVEKHITLRRDDGGPDSAFSLEPDEFRRLVAGCKSAARAVGVVKVGAAESARSNVQFRRSLYAVADIPKGGLLDRSNVRSIRPGFGLEPKHLDRVLGRRAVDEIRRGTPLRWELMSGPKP